MERGGRDVEEEELRVFEEVSADAAAGSWFCLS